MAKTNDIVAGTVSQMMQYLKSLIFCQNLIFCRKILPSLTFCASTLKSFGCFDVLSSIIVSSCWTLTAHLVKWVQALKTNATGEWLLHISDGRSQCTAITADASVEVPQRGMGVMRIYLVIGMHRIHNYQIRPDPDRIWIQHDMESKYSDRVEMSLFYCYLHLHFLELKNSPMVS